MWFVLGVVALVAVVVAVASVLRRPRSEDLSSVRHYHSALGTLEHLSERTVEAPIKAPLLDEPAVGEETEPRFYRRPDAAAGFHPGSGLPAGAGIGEGAGEGVDAERTSPRRSREVPPALRSSDHPDPGDALVFDDARPRDRHQPDSTATAPRLRLDRAQRHALHAMNHRPRRGLAVTALAVVAVVLFGVLAIVGSRHPPAKRTT
ncbi:MAG: hypothetical protein ACRDYE_10495, partial [Acidimicrobiales bacterium]